MTTITRYYGISTPVPFVDVDVDKDTALFLDPHRIRLHARTGDAYALQAQGCVDGFMDQVLQCVAHSNATQGTALLESFTEPRETRLGLSRQGFNGHGSAKVLGGRIWQELTTDLKALIELGLLRHLEQLPLFIEGVDKDITSDVTTRIVFRALADYTSHIMAAYPEFTSNGHTTVTTGYGLWDVTSQRWCTSSLTLPVAAGRPLLLVPKPWAERNLMMYQSKYYEKSVLDYAQSLQATTNSDGTVNQPTKKVLKKQKTPPRGRDTNILWTLRAHRDHNVNLPEAFERHVDR